MTKVRKNIHMPKDLSNAINDYRHAMKFASETEAIIELLRFALVNINAKEKL
jgi:hypothetical protein